MSGTEKSHAALLDDLAALDPAQRREVAGELRQVAETFAGVPDGQTWPTHSGCWRTSSIRLLDSDGIAFLCPG
jgi:hypothetical protein